MYKISSIDNIQNVVTERTPPLCRFTSDGTFLNRNELSVFCENINASVPQIMNEEDFDVLLSL